MPPQPSFEKDVLTIRHGYLFKIFGRAVYWTEFVLFLNFLFAVGVLIYHFIDPQGEHLKKWIIAAVWGGMMLLTVWFVWGKATLGTEEILQNLKREVDGMRDINNKAEENNEAMEANIDRFSSMNDDYGESIAVTANIKKGLEEKAGEIGESLEGIELLLEEQADLLNQKELSNRTLDMLNRAEDINLWKTEMTALWENTNQDCRMIDDQLKRQYYLLELDEKVLWKTYGWNGAGQSFNGGVGREKVMQKCTDRERPDREEKDELAAFMVRLKDNLHLALNVPGEGNDPSGRIAEIVRLDEDKRPQGSMEPEKREIYRFFQSRYKTAPEAPVENKDLSEEDRRGLEELQKKLFASGKIKKRTPDFVACQNHLDRQKRLFEPPPDKEDERKGMTYRSWKDDRPQDDDSDPVGPRTPDDPPSLRTALKAIQASAVSKEDKHIAFLMLIEKIDENTEFQRSLFLSTTTYLRLVREKEEKENRLSELNVRLAKLASKQIGGKKDF